MNVRTGSPTNFGYVTLITLMWAALAAACGTAVWALLSVVIEGARSGQLSRAIVMFYAGLVYGGLVATTAVPAYWLLFFGYAVLFTRYPGVEATVPRLAGVALLLALPFAVVLAWSEGLAYGSLCWLSAAAGILIPRLASPSLRPGAWWVGL